MEHSIPTPFLKSRTQRQPVSRMLMSIYSLARERVHKSRQRVLWMVLDPRATEWSGLISRQTLLLTVLGAMTSPQIASSWKTLSTHWKLKGNQLVSMPVITCGLKLWDLPPIVQSSPSIHFGTLTMTMWSLLMTTLNCLLEDGLNPR